MKKLILTQAYFSKNLLLLLFALFTSVLVAQNTNDTLNKFNSKHKKQGYWTFYFDSLFNRCEINNANYYGFIYYNNGVATAEPLGRTNEKDELVYKPYNDTINRKTLVVLNGELFQYALYDTIKKCEFYEAFKNGVTTTAIQYMNWRIKLLPEVFIHHFDSLYQKNTNSFLFYKKDDGIVLYKQYQSCSKPRNLTERIYFVKHRDFKSINRLIIGGSMTFGQTPDKLHKPKSFAEIGFSKKFISGTYIDTTGRTYRDNGLVFHALNFSLLGSFTNKQACFGQKITYSYNLLFLRGEAGLINYTDGKNIDPRLTFGFGLTVFGFFNEMVNFSIPLTRNKIDDVPQFLFSLQFN